MANGRMSARDWSLSPSVREFVDRGGESIGKLFGNADDDGFMHEIIGGDAAAGNDTTATCNLRRLDSLG